jgi:hypothetical protein
VQHLGESLSRGPEVKAFARSVIVSGDQRQKTSVLQGCKVGLARQESTHPSDGILDAALLPGRIGITEEGLDRQVMQSTMACELGAIVEGDGLTQRLRHDTKQSDEVTSDAVRRLAGQPDRQQETGLALMHG